VLICVSASPVGFAKANRGGRQRAGSELAREQHAALRRQGPRQRAAKLIRGLKKSTRNSFNERSRPAIHEADPWLSKPFPHSCSTIRQTVPTRGHCRRCPRCHRGNTPGPRHAIETLPKRPRTKPKCHPFLNPLNFLSDINVTIAEL